MNGNRAKVVVVAGASSGIGAACAEHLHQAGWRVAALARSLEYRKEQAFLSLPVDLLDGNSARESIQTVLREWEGIDAVVHCVGNIEESLPMSQMPWERWRGAYDLCVGTALTLVQETFDSVARARGAYVFVSSIAASHPYPGISDYCAAKAALGSLSRSLADELAPHQARANTISPAVVDTPLFRRSPYTVEQAAKWHRLGRIGRPGEIAAMANYLIEEDSAWITGQDFIMDGGMRL